MDYVTWALVGLVAGVIARVLHPGRDPGGLLLTVALGIAGAYVAGFVARELDLDVGEVEGLDVRSIAIATAGAFLLLVAWRVLFGRRGDD